MSGIVLRISMAKTSKIVVDSSVIVKWLNSQDEKYLEQADKLLKDCEGNKVSLYAPELAKYEIGNAIYYKGLDLSLAKACLATLYSLPITFVSIEEDDALKILEIAGQNKATYYDAAFISLTEKINASLVTDNPKHQKGIKEAKVIALKDYK